MNGLTASEKLGIGPEIREIKFGDSFSGKGGRSFHTIRYDFKPASVDPTKMATLDVNNSQVTISMQNTDMTSTVFTGPRKPYGKECVLIIDPETGECVLEKLTHSIQVKKTRQEGASRVSKALPPAPAPPPEIKKHHIVTGGISSSQNHRIADSKSSNHERKPSKPSLPPTSSTNSLSSSLASSNPTQRRPHSPMLSVPSRHSPLSTSPGRLSPNNGSGNVNAFDALLSNHSKQSKQQLHHHPPPQHHHQQQQQHTVMPSLTNFEDLLAGTGTSSISGASGNSPAALSTSSSASFRGNGSSYVPSANSPYQSVTIPSLPTTGISSSATTALSESSSGDSSSSISSSDDDESSDDEDMEVVPEPDPDMTEISMPSMPSIPISSFSSLSARSTVPPINRSMPSHLLSEDLQLSDSD